MPSRLLRLVADVLEVPVTEIGPDTGPATAGQWVSLRHLQIVARVEEAYDVSITPREIRRIKSVEDLRDVLRRRGVAE
jgi:acyl carrier protein